MHKLLSAKPIFIEEVVYTKYKDIKGNMHIVYE